MRGANLLKRNKIIFILGILAILAVAGIFLFRDRNKKEESPSFEKHVDDFVIEGNIIRNEKKKNAPINEC